MSEKITFFSQREAMPHVLKQKRGFSEKSKSIFKVDYLMDGSSKTLHLEKFRIQQKSKNLSANKTPSQKPKKQRFSDVEAVSTLVKDIESKIVLDFKPLSKKLPKYDCKP